MTGTTTDSLRFLKSPRAAFLGIVVAFLFAAYARVVDLGADAMWFDELLHAMAAQSVARGEGPRLPSGQMYARNLEFTRLVAIGQRYIADPEAAARAPSAVFGIAGLIVFAAIAWRMVGAWPSFWATLLLGIFPTALFESRNSRFYTIQLLFGLVALYAGWRTLEPTAADDAPEDGSAELKRRWAWAALTLVAFGGAARIQPTTMSILAGWGVAVAWFAALDVRRHGLQVVRRSVPLQLVIAGTVAVLALVLLIPNYVFGMLKLAVAVPLWAQGQSSPREYYWMLHESFPLVVALLPLIFFVVARRSLELAAFLFIWFAVPIGLHSFVFQFQADRYVLLAIPALLLATAVAASDGCGALYRAVVDYFERRDPGRATWIPLAAATGLVGMVAATAVVTSPAFTRARKLVTYHQSLRASPDWGRALEILKATPGLDSLPWGAQEHLGAHFYWHRVDFSISNGLLQGRPVGPASPGRPQYKIREQGSRDIYLNIPVYSTPQALKQRFGVGHDIIIVVDSTRENGETADLARAWHHAGASRELCEGRCGTLHLYRWTLSDSTGQDNQ